MDVLIFDDDPLFGELVAEVVQSAGYTAEKTYDAFKAIETIEAAKPRLIILDIMMPGVDGLTLCRMIKSHPVLSPIPVIAVSAKGFKQDQEEALRCGADLFLPKPCDMEALKRAVVERLKGPTAGVKSERAPAFYARVFGCRAASAATNAPPTSCVLLALGGKFIILDAGSGLTSLSRTPISSGEDLWVLLTHYHEDHICALSALQALSAGVPKVNIAGPTDTRRPLQDVIRERLGSIKSCLPPGSEAHNIAESNFLLWKDVKVSTMFTQHPGSTLAYRISWKGRKLVYCPDNALEPAGAARSHFREKIVQFVRGADVLLHDARYSDEALPSAPEPGHSCPSRAVDLALEAGVRQLILFHLDAAYAEDRLARIALDAQINLRKSYSPLRVEMAQAGTVVGV